MEFRWGDRVRLTIEGVVEGTNGGDGIYIHGNWFQPSGFTDVEVIAATDGPETDAEGTWRSDDVDGTLFRKNNLGAWISSASGERFDNRMMGGSTVVQVDAYPPGTPAPQSVGLSTVDSPEPGRHLHLVDAEGDRWAFFHSTWSWHLQEPWEGDTQPTGGYSWEEMVRRPHWFPMRAFTE